MFNTSQPAYRNLRSIIKERTNPILLWIGSGLSVSAGLPTWRELRIFLEAELELKFQSFPPEEHARYSRLLSEIRSEKDTWLAFQYIKRELGDTSYRTAVRSALAKSDTCGLPVVYKRILELPISGILNLNLDRLATRALSEVRPGILPDEFNGREAYRHAHVLKGNKIFIANLHGISADAESWILTKEDLVDLLKRESYRDFIITCILSRTILFAGISVDDIAVGGFIESLCKQKIDWGQHFWITIRSDAATDQWAEENNIQIIRYTTLDDKHEELSALLADLKVYEPEEPPAGPITLTKQTINPGIKPVSELVREPSLEVLRQELNAYAGTLLKDPTAENYLKYDAFCKEYDEAIYRAWYVTTTQPGNILFGYKLEEEISEGAFGRVFRARKGDGSEYAVKVLKETIRQKRDMLQSFRRGVRSMRILADRKVKGMVPYEEASEIPAFCVMEFIKGPDLHRAVECKYCEDWETILEISYQLAKVIRNAHKLPERVLHRDIRPSNVMLKDFYSDDSEIRVVVLDFDLSWHMGAYELSVLHQSVNGFLAPELVTRIRGASTRNAAVDSFGLGMTLYFLRTGIEPKYLQHLHKTWQLDLQASICRHKCDSWQSLPRRFARLIDYATKNSQAERIDMAQIENELEDLRFTVLNPTKVKSVESIAEELAQRAVLLGVSSEYAWNVDKSMANIVLASGVDLRISPSDTKNKIRLRADWNQHGDRLYKNVRKYLPGAIDQSISLMREKGWHPLGETTLRSDYAGFSMEIKTENLLARLDESAAALAASVKKFDF